MRFQTSGPDKADARGAPELFCSPRRRAEQLRPAAGSVISRDPAQAGCPTSDIRTPAPGQGIYCHQHSGEGVGAASAAKIIDSLRLRNTDYPRNVMPGAAAVSSGSKQRQKRTVVQRTGCWRWNVMMAPFGRSPRDDGEKGEKAIQSHPSWTIVHPFWPPRRKGFQRVTTRPGQ